MTKNILKSRPALLGAELLSEKEQLGNNVVLDYLGNSASKLMAGDRTGTTSPDTRLIRFLEALLIPFSLQEPSVYTTLSAPTTNKSKIVSLVMFRSGVRRTLTSPAPDLTTFFASRCRSDFPFRSTGRVQLRDSPWSVERSPRQRAS